MMGVRCDSQDLRFAKAGKFIVDSAVEGVALTIRRANDYFIFQP